MKILPFGKKHWILSPNEGNRGFNCLCLSQKGNTLSIEHFQQIISPKDIPAKSAHVVFYSERLLVSKESFFATKKEILELQIDEKMRLIGPWAEGTRVKHAMHLLSKGEQQNEYIILSLPENDIENVVNQLSNDIRIKKCSVHVAAIASIVGKLTDELILSCFLANGFLEIIVSEKGIPYYSQISPLEILPTDDLSIISQAIYNVRQIIGSKLNKSVKKTIFFTRQLDEIPRNIQNEDIWIPDVSKLVKNDNEGLFFKYPELFGAIFVSNDFDLLPKKLKQTYLFQDINKVATSIALVGSIALGISTPYLINKKNNQLITYQKLYQKVQQEKRTIQKQLPTIEQTQEINNLLSLWNNIQNEPSIVNILLDISKSIPQEVILDHINITRQAISKDIAQNSNDDININALEYGLDNSSNMENSINAKHNLLDTPLSINITFFSQGSFRDVKNNFEETTIRLGKFFDLKEVNWSYKEQEKSGILNCKILLNRKNEAVYNSI